MKNNHWLSIAKLALCTTLLIYSFFGQYYLIPVASLALAIVLENDFSISSKIKMFVSGRGKPLHYYEQFLIKRYGTDKVYISVSTTEYGLEWYARVQYFTASGITFDKLVEQLDRNLEVHEQTMRQAMKKDVLV